MFKPGDPRPVNGGRRPGSPNKKTLALLDLWDIRGFCPAEKLLELFDQMDFETKVDVCVKLMDYKFPKRKAVEITGADGAELKLSLEDFLKGKKDAANVIEVTPSEPDKTIGQ